MLKLIGYALIGYFLYEVGRALLGESHSLATAGPGPGRSGRRGRASRGNKGRMRASEEAGRQAHLGTEVMVQEPDGGSHRQEVGRGVVRPE